MSEVNAAPLFPQKLVFQDVDAAVLAREEHNAAQPRSGAWQTYLQRRLPPRPVTSSQAAS
jgi:hypothetical protein